MSVLIALAVFFGFAALCAGFFYLPAYVLHRGQKVVTCPDDAAAASVEVNAVRYAATSMLDQPVVELKSCSRWPAKAGCGQACAGQIEGAPA
jgi:hypothetical protein